jgi:phytanoyl-CoA hydroxylase
MRNTDYLNAIATRMPSLADAVVTPALRKGDAILWHGNLIHGAHPVTDSRFSRKSVTAHYVPRTLVGRGNARVLSNRVMRVATRMPYVVTTKPEPTDRGVVASEINTVQIDGAPVRFLCLETADGERTVVTANSVPVIIDSQPRPESDKPE